MRPVAEVPQPSSAWISSIGAWSEKPIDGYQEPEEGFRYQK
jgi:hypothetical protein